MSELVINEIFLSIQGESSYAGYPCAFVRTTGCDLRCRWCDTSYARTDGTRMAVSEVVARVVAYDCPLVEITGGEPLCQSAVHPLVEKLLDAGRSVLVETGGHMDISLLNPRVVRIMDLKAPGSGMCARNRWENIPHLGPRDEVKIVLASRGDYEWAREACQKHDLVNRCKVVHFSCVFGELKPKVLAEWIIADRLPVRLHLQLHKLIWEPSVRGV